MIFFAYLQKNVKSCEIHILFLSGNGATYRKWSGGEEKLNNVHFLDSWVFLSTGFTINERMVPRGLIRALTSIKADVIVCAEYSLAALFSCTYARIKRIPFVSWSDGTRHSERNIGFLQKLSRKYIVRLSSAFIASSRATKENQIYLGADPKHIFVSELCIDQKKFMQRKKEYEPGKKLIYVGSLIPRKGLDLLISSLYRLSDINWILDIVGEGPEEASLKQELKALGISERVHFRGYLDGEALKKAYEKASIFVFPTREDCFGLVILEAMCAGLPIISSKFADGAHDLVIQGENGYIVDPINIREFASALRTVLENGYLQRKMSEKSQELAKKFDFKYTAPHFMKAVRAADRKRR